MSLANRVTKSFNKNEIHSFEDTCLRILSLCKSESLEKGLCVHSPVIKLGLQGNLLLSNSLLSLYGKCYGAEHARHLFDEMPHRDVVSWTGLVPAYSRNGKHDEALEVFDSMIFSGQKPNEFTIPSVLRSCSAVKEFDEGIRIHACVIKLGLESNVFLLSSLIDFYTKCGGSEEAYKIFGDMNGGDTVTWTTIISSLVQAQKWRLALQHYGDMICARVTPNELTFVKLLAASCHLDSRYGKLLHAHLVVLGIRLSLILKTALVDMYSSCQNMEDAIRVLHQTPEYDVWLWTSLVSGFTRKLQVKEAVFALHEMEIVGISPNSFTYTNLLKACSTVSSLELGKQIHARVIMTGLDADVCVGNALVDMYMKCSRLVEDGLKAFKGIASLDVISWTSLIAGFSEHGFEQDSFDSFLQMRAFGVQPNSFTLSTILHACSTIKSRSQTLKLHGYIIKVKAYSDIVVGNALIYAYAALGMVDDSWHVLRMMRHKDTITYTSLATRMNKLGDPEMALAVINCMSNDGVKMDGFSLASFLSASAALGSMETGKQLHCYAIKSGFGSFTSVLNGLIEFYWKCGHANNGYRAFQELSEPDVVSWNGLISGLASNGYISDALSAFDEMRLAGFKPDSVTFLSVLFACSCGRLVDLGIEYFNSMKSKYDVTPQLAHFIHFVDLLGQAGKLEDATEVVAAMPFKPDPLIYKTLLRSCRLHGNVPLGEDMARRGLELDPYDLAFYSLLANLYDNSGHSDLAKKTRQLMRDRGLRKNLGESWIELRNKVHIFNSGYKSHPQMNEIHEKIASLTAKLKKQGYSFTDTEGSVYHSEKLALAFGLLYKPSNAAIRIIKNKHICSECHEFIKLVTRLIDRDISVRDGNRIHTFKGGECLCCDKGCRE